MYKIPTDSTVLSLTFLNNISLVWLLVKVIRSSCSRIAVAMAMAMAMAMTAIDYH